MAAPRSKRVDTNDLTIALIGAGGHARETLLMLQQCGVEADRIAGFFVDDQYWSDGLVDGQRQFKLDTFDPKVHCAVIAVGDSQVRRRIAASMPADTCYPSFAHPSSILPDYLELPEGVMIHAGCIITTNVRIERHVQLNRSTNVGHDCVLREFATTAPGAVISGNCEVGAAAYLGAMSSIREKQRIGEDAVVGMGAVVVTDVPARAVYVGNPARAIARKSL